MDDDVSRLRHAADVRYAVDRVNNDAIFRAGSEPRQRHSTQTDQDQDHTHTDRQTDRQGHCYFTHITSDTAATANTPSSLCKKVSK